MILHPVVLIPSVQTRVKLLPVLVCQTLLDRPRIADMSVLSVVIVMTNWHVLHTNAEIHVQEPVAHMPNVMYLIIKLCVNVPETMLEIHLSNVSLNNIIPIDPKC